LSPEAFNVAADSQPSFLGEATRFFLRHGVPKVGDWLGERKNWYDPDSDPKKPPSWWPTNEPTERTDIPGALDLPSWVGGPEMLVGPEDNSNRLDTARSAALHDFGGATGEELARLQAIDRFGHVPDDQGNPERFDPGYHLATQPIGDLFPVGPGEELPPVDVRVPTNYPVRRLS
jgi:hypothetical protein